MMKNIIFNKIVYTFRNILVKMKLKFKLRLFKLVKSDFKPLYEEPQKTQISTFFGEKMIVFPPEEVSVKLIKNGYFEENLTYMFLKKIKKEMTVLDIGTHFGYFTLLASRLVGEKGQVHSFEPTPSTFSVLKENTENKKNIKINNIAMWSSKTKIKFKDYGIAFSAFNTIFDARLDEDKRNKLKIQEHNIDTSFVDLYVSEKNIIPNFIKIDAESAEFEIIKGMQKTIEKFKPMISLEVGDQNIKNVPKCKEIINFILDKRYDVFEYNGKKLIKHKVLDKYKYSNLLFCPKK